MSGFTLLRNTLATLCLVFCLAASTRSALYAQEGTGAIAQPSVDPAPAAPALLLPADGATTTGQSHPPLGIPELAWQPVPGADLKRLMPWLWDGGRRWTVRPGYRIDVDFAAADVPIHEFFAASVVGSRPLQVVLPSGEPTSLRLKPRGGLLNHPGLGDLPTPIRETP